MAASLARLTSLSTQTLSLLLERQRLQTLPSNSSLHAPQIVRNLEQLRAGILALEGKDGLTEATRLLRAQHERMRGMLGAEADSLGVQRCEEPSGTANADASSSSSPSPPATTSILPPPRTSSSEPEYAPYTDDPEAGYSSEEMLLQQRHMMDEQDVRLDELSHSITRQRDISLQINDELDVHTGLLEGLDHDLDRTDSRLTNARRRLDRVARGAKENGSTLMIALLILVLLILIIVFKT
ncbi:hypothetical protein C8Q74DRAFT_1356664 [Fomes fomentarius]|nr:hypothetical protein C8Q74DRAFT_1356664 [Fomes fomentarius]